MTASEEVLEPLLRMGISSVESAIERLRTVGGIVKPEDQKAATYLVDAHQHLVQAINLTNGWARANGITIRDKMKT